MQNGDSKAIGTLNYFKPNRLDLLESFASGDTVHIRFRLHSDAERNGWGWAIDNLRIQDRVTALNPERNAFAIFPNPFTDVLHIHRPLQQPETIQLFNLLGQCVFQGNLYAAESSIDLSFLPSGIYLLTRRLSGRTEQYKLLKQ
ncbi:MAG: hypothetical protein KatS3mg032_1207 [Cyclobacteriaceae bacterium]|nr:MAG: hypothetical protein KatS3mg032_1207 [Cyclobacteriaceae bacterium]